MGSRSLEFEDDCKILMDGKHVYTENILSNIYGIGSSILLDGMITIYIRHELRITDINID